jgi:hypothetical protein
MPKKSQKSLAAAALSKLGAKKGGFARAASLSPEQRKEIARKAGKAGAAARWGKKKPAKANE